jgi:hypothetical protein
MCSGAVWRHPAERPSCIRAACACSEASSKRACTTREAICGGVAQSLRLDFEHEPLVAIMGGLVTATTRAAGQSRVADRAALRGVAIAGAAYVTLR